ncbi:hypothetical protein [Alkalicoccus chagannorensis]|uniref:hypothetical protein n=1 Tax=Alkalicoccus chagannorensis TaxID=427072 RepID=UPI000402F93D|nr:hypothetical protein [Alkalicoccus chagannorensis]
MKSGYALPGAVLFVIGVYFITEQYNILIPYADIIVTWPSIFAGIGFIFMWQGFSNKDDQKMFTGTLLTGLGILFHGVHTLGLWSYQWPYFTLVIGAAFLTKYRVQRRDGLLAGIVLMAVSGAALFQSELAPAFRIIPDPVMAYWPVLFVLVGMYLLFISRK